MAARGWQLVGLGAILALGGSAAQGENLDAGKSGAALFAASCQTCHSSPRGLAKNQGSGLTSFLQEHYTSGPQSAALLANYLAANPGAPPSRAKQTPAGEHAAATPSERGASSKRHEKKNEPPQSATTRPDAMVEPVETHHAPAESAKGRGKRQQTKQEAPAAPAASAPEPVVAQPAPAAPAPAAAPVAATPPPDQPAFSAPSP